MQIYILINVLLLIHLYSVVYTNKAKAKLLKSSNFFYEFVAIHISQTERPLYD